MPKMTGGQALAKSLYREGVRVIFGLPGVQLYHMMDGLYDEPGIRFINTRHEQATTYMADGYARAGGGIGTALVVTLSNLSPSGRIESWTRQKYQKRSTRHSINFKLAGPDRSRLRFRRRPWNKWLTLICWSQEYTSDPPLTQPEFARPPR